MRTDPDRFGHAHRGNFSSLETTTVGTITFLCSIAILTVSLFALGKMRSIVDQMEKSVDASRESLEELKKEMAKE